MTEQPRLFTPPDPTCQRCLRIARRGHGRLPAIAAMAVVSPTGKGHWRAVDGYTFCGHYARHWDG